MPQKQSMIEDSRRQRRRRQRDQPHPGRPVVVMREPRLELCHPDDFHALRDVDVPAAVDVDAALPLVCPRHSVNVDEQPLSSTSSLMPLFVPFSYSCAAGCCDGLYEDNLVHDDVIPLPVHYVAEQDDDDDDCGDVDAAAADDDNDESDDDDDGCSDSNRQMPSKFILILR